MHKPRKRSGTVATAIRLPEELHDWLRSRPSGLTESIKLGLELLKETEGVDEPTRELAFLLFDIAHEVKIEIGATWYSDKAAYRAFWQAVSFAMSKWRPADYDSHLEKILVAPFQSRLHATQPINDADDLGRSLAEMVLGTPDRAQRGMLRKAMESSLKELVKLHEQRGGEGNG
jgi:hypothetical protein